MRLVLDSNVLVAAFIARGACAELVETALAEHEVFASEALLSEFQRALTVKLRVSPELTAEAVSLLRSRTRIVEPVNPDPPLCRDPDDDRILGTAAAGDCRCLVTADRDLLVLGNYQGIDIIPPRRFWALAELPEEQPGE